MVSCQVSHGAIQFMVYEELKKATGSYNAWRSPSQSASDSATLASLQISLIGAASKLAATVTTYPLQVLSFEPVTCRLHRCLTHEQCMGCCEGAVDEICARSWHNALWFDTALAGCARCKSCRSALLCHQSVQRLCWLRRAGTDVDKL